MVCITHALWRHQILTSITRLFARRSKEVGKFWLTEVGVDGFRLDAARHIYDYENSKPVSPDDCNAVWWSEFCAEMKVAKPDCLIIGEIWKSWPLT